MNGSMAVAVLPNFVMQVQKFGASSSEKI